MKIKIKVDVDGKRVYTIYRNIKKIKGEYVFEPINDFNEKINHIFNNLDDYFVTKKPVRDSYNIKGEIS